MLLFPVALGGGVAIGLLRGGRLRSLASVRFRAGPVVGFAVALQVLLGWTPAGSRFALVLVSYALIGAWLAVNALVPARGHGAPALRLALGVVAAGWALNVVVMALNGGMPVSRHALDAVGGAGTDVEAGHLWKHVEADAGTRLPWLGDSIAVPFAPFRGVISAGDVAMLTGVGLAVVAAMPPRPRRHPRAELVVAG